MTEILTTRGIAIITGAARGIGRSVAERLAHDGWTVAGVDIDPAVRELNSVIAGARSFEMDVTDEDQWSRCVESLDSAGSIGALVNCAGILGSEVEVVELSVEEWRQVLEVNLTGTFLGCRAVLPSMLGRGHGRIVNISSIAGKEGNARQAGYSASKAGVIGFTKALAKEVARRGVTVNAITPTVIEGPFSAAMSEELREEIRRKIPMGRFGRSEEVAAMVAWICSDECSFTTGSVFDLTGGRATY